MLEHVVRKADDGATVDAPVQPLADLHAIKGQRTTLMPVSKSMRPALFSHGTEYTVQHAVRVLQRALPERQKVALGWEPKHFPQAFVARVAHLSFKGDGELDCQRVVPARGTNKEIEQRRLKFGQEKALDNQSIFLCIL